MRSYIAGQRDVFDVLKALFNMDVTSEDTVRKQKGTFYVAAIPAVGYSSNTQFAVTIGANAAIYTDDVDSVNLSTFNFNPTYTFKRQVMLPIQSNVWTAGNEYNFLGNWIFYKFPELTYGLGGHTQESVSEQLDYRFILFREAVLKKMYKDVYAGAGYDIDYHWNITDGGLPGGAISDFQRYGRTTKSTSSGYTLDVMYDGRQNPINPQKGYYASVVYRNNSTFLGSDANWQSLILDLRRYYRLPSDSRNTLAFWSYDWFILRGNPPYLDLPASSWDTYANQGRGYIQSRFRGKNLISFESEYRFVVTHDGLFGGVVFANVQSVSDWPGNRFTVLHPGVGCGIRFKMNKYSDTNVALDFGLGLHGSNGVFVNLGEVFRVSRRKRSSARSYRRLTWPNSFRTLSRSPMKKMSLCLPCFILLSIILNPGGAVAQTSGGSPALDVHHQLARDIFRELIEINTTLTRGSTKAAEAMAARLRAGGFPESDIHVVGPQPQHMNVVVRLRGKGLLRPILFISHLDVVEALRQDWSVDPFIFIEKDGYFYGRGTTDIKCEDADLVANLIRLKQEGYVPSRDVIVALTEDEENGNANGVQWLLASRRDLIDAEYCINPDGGGGEIKNGKPVVMEVQTSEKIYIDYRLESTNKGGHSSLPVKDNAIYHLAGALTRLAAFDFPIRLNETTRLFFERSAVHETGRTRSDMLAMAKTPLDTAAANRLARSSPYYNSLMRTTCVATMIQGGHAENALPQMARANVNCRMLPDDSPDDVMSTLRSVIADTQVTVTSLVAATRGPLSPLRADVMEALERLTPTMWPGAIVMPTMSTGASDGKAVRLAGIPVYGISGMFTDIDDVRAHGRDERLGVTEFYKGVDFTYVFIKALTAGS